MSTSKAVLTRAATLVGVCLLVVAGAQVSGAKTTAKGKPTRGSAYVADTHTVGSKIYAAGAGIDKVLGPAAVTLVFSAPAPTAQPGVVKATAQPMILWLRTGTMVGTGKVLLNTNTGQLTGHGAFTGATGTLKGHSLVVGSFRGTADRATGRFHYTYTGVYK